MKCMESMQVNMKCLEKELEKVKSEGCGLSVCRGKEVDKDSSFVNDKSVVEVEDGEIIEKQNVEEILLEEWPDKDSSMDCSEVNEDGMKKENKMKKMMENNNMKDLVNYIKEKDAIKENDGIFDEIDEAIKAISDEEKLDEITKGKRKLKVENNVSAKKLCDNVKNSR